MYAMYVIEQNRNNYYLVMVELLGTPPTPEQELIARKILFSFRLKGIGGLTTQLKSESTDNIYTLTGDNVNVRAEAATNGAVLLKLSKGAKVMLLKRSDTALTVGDKKGFWAYVDTQVTNKDGESIKGWVFDYYLKEEK